MECGKEARESREDQQLTNMYSQYFGPKSGKSQLRHSESESVDFLSLSPLNRAVPIVGPMELMVQNFLFAFLILFLFTETSNE